MKKKIIVLMIIMVFSKALSFMRELLMSYYYGASSYTDVYIMASTAANILFGWMLSFQIVHTPLYQEIKYRKDEKNANGFSIMLIGIQLGVGLLGLIFTLFHGDFLIRILAKGFDNRNIGTANIFFIWALVSVLINAVCTIIISECTCNEKIIFPSLTNLIVSVFQIIIIAVSGYAKNYMGLKYVLPVSALSQLLLLVLMLIKSDHWVSFEFEKKKYLQTFLKLIFPIFVVYMMSDLNSFIDKMFGSMLPEGSISALHYGYLLQHTVFTMIITALTTVIYPRMAKSAAADRGEDMRNTLINGTEVVVVIFSFLSFFIVFYARQIIVILFSRGAFDETAIVKTTQCTQLYLLALLPLAFKEFVSKVFQAVQNMKVNMYIGAVAIVVNLVLDYALYSKYKHIGLAFATCVATYSTIPIIIYYLSKEKDFSFINRKTLAGYVKIVGSSFISVLTPVLIMRSIDRTETTLFTIIYLLIAFVVAASIYCILLCKLNLIEKLAKW